MSFPFPNDNLLLKEETSGPRAPYSNAPVSFDMDYVVEKWDFIRGLDVSSTDWLTVKDASATAAVGADASCGSVVLSSAATTDDDGASIQSIQECYQLTTGKKLWLEMLVQTSDATQSEHFFGLSVAFATNPEAVLSAANRVGFAKVDGSTSCLISCVSSAAGTTQTVDTGKVWVAATNKRLNMYWDGAGKLNFYVDREYVGQLTSGIPTATAMAIALYHLSGDASGTKTSTIDYVAVARER